MPNYPDPTDPKNSDPNAADRTNPEPDPALTEKARSQPKENAWAEAAKTIGLSLVLALGIRHFVAEARYIPSESMVPTLEVNDRLIVEKITYRLNPPQRGDIVVFYPPEQAGAECSGSQTPTHLKDAFIKRVVGLPGDTIEVRDGTMFVNGQPLPETYTAARPSYAWGPQTVPENSYFVFGDNRNNSCDSHYWGAVPRENIIGRAVFRFWPPGRLGNVPSPNYGAAQP